MEIQERTGKVADERKATEYLANERTFLAWVRTSIAIISLGFVIAKFGLWFGEFATRLDPQLQQVRTGSSIPIGLAMISFGGVLTILAAWRYHVVNRSIERGEVKADRGLVLLVTALIALLSITMIVYMLISIEHL
jgi:putative membrane protein